jgi:hypothetical protein
MKPTWYPDITFDTLPDDFQVSALEMEECIKPLLTPTQQLNGLARKLAVEAVKADMVINEGRTNRYYPSFEGDKFCYLRHDAIRTDYWKQIENETYELRRFLDKWGITERTLRTIKNSGKDPRQMEAFPEE